MAFLQSQFPAYVAAPGKKKSFWDDLFPAWDRKYPPKDAPASTKPLNSLVDGYGSEPEDEELEDPNIRFARTVSRAVGFIYLVSFS